MRLKGEESRCWLEERKRECEDCEANRLLEHTPYVLSTPRTKRRVCDMHSRSYSVLALISRQSTHISSRFSHCSSSDLYRKFTPLSDPERQREPSLGTLPSSVICIVRSAHTCLVHHMLFSICFFICRRTCRQTLPLSIILWPFSFTAKLAKCDACQQTKCRAC